MEEAEGAGRAREVGTVSGGFLLLLLGERRYDGKRRRGKVSVPNVQLDTVC